MMRVQASAEAVERSCKEVFEYEKITFDFIGTYDVLVGYDIFG